MNREQRQRVEDIGRAVQHALTDIIDMGEGDIQEEVCQERAYEEESIPMPVDLNERLATHEINIKHVHNGFIVSVGCQTFVFETFDKLAKYMAIYYDDPQGTYEKHYKGELLK